MGNGVSCRLSCIAVSSTRLPPTAKLVDSNGRTVRRVQLPRSVAELMIEFPGNVVSRGEDLVIARRVKGMRADEQLRPGVVYLLFRRHRVGSRIDDLQVAIVQGALSRGGGGMKKRTLDSAAADKKDGTGCSGRQGDGPLRGQWRPLLDTITEFN